MTRKLTAINALVWAVIATLALVLGASTWPAPVEADHPGPHSSPVTGSWIGKVHGAQYEDHLFQFHADGTMISSNPSNVQEKPDGTGVNDSTGQGNWHQERGKVVGTFVELNAGQTTHKPAADLTVRFTVEVHGDHLTGTAKVWVGTEQVPDASFDFQRIV
jgi:hypothetical protein